VNRAPDLVAVHGLESELGDLFRVPALDVRVDKFDCRRAVLAKVARVRLESEVDLGRDSPIVKHYSSSKNSCFLILVSTMPYVVKVKNYS
jgi:hypothetical protein